MDDPMLAPVAVGVVERKPGLDMHHTGGFMIVRAGPRLRGHPGT